MVKKDEQEKTPQKSKMDILEETITELIDMVGKVSERVAVLEKTTGKKSGLFGGKRKRTAIRDTKTGKIYVSKASCAKNVAAEFGLDPLDSFAWYKIQAQSPDRFVDATEEERAKAEAEDAERLEKIRLEGQARLDAEAAEKAKAEAKPETS